MDQPINVPALNIAQAPLPAVYVEAKNALAQCATVDECKDWSDKAEAMRSYARQAKDETLYKTAIRIQVRAQRRCGELLKTFQSPGERTDKPMEGDHPRFESEPRTQRQAANSAGLSEHQEKQAVRLANVSEDDFERAVESDKPPTVTALARQGTNRADKAPAAQWTPPDGFQEATQLLGTVRRFAEFCEANEPEKIANGILENETAKVRRMVATIDVWLDRLVVNLGG